MADSQREAKKLEKLMASTRKNYQTEILAEAASLCPLALQDRYISKGGIHAESFTWKTAAVLDKGVSLDDLRALHTLVMRRKELYAPLK